MRRMKSEAQSSRRPLPQRQRRWLKPLLYAVPALLGVGVLGGGAWWLSSQGYVARAKLGMQQSLVDLSAGFGLVVADVTVEGRRRQEPEPLLAAIGLKRGDPILPADLEAMRGRLEALSWVREAAVERRLPGRLHVRLVEREPMALWQRGGQFMLVDREGVEIGPDLAGEFSHLPVIVGPDAPQHAGALFAALAAEPELAGRVKAAVRVGGRRWNVRIDDIAGGIDVRLPEAQTAAAWTRLARLDREYQLLERKLLMIDLRLPDRLVVSQPEGAATDSQPGKKRKPHDKDA